MIPLTRTDTFNDPITGAVIPKWFVSELGGSCLEWSMHDDTIKSILPLDFWMPVFTAGEKSLRQDVIDDAIVFLVGFGTDSDSAGRLMFLRYRVDRQKLSDGDPQTFKHFKDALSVVSQMLAPHGFDANKSLWDTHTKN